MRARLCTTTRRRLLLLESLERRDVPAVILDYDLVTKSPADFKANSLIIQLPANATPDYTLGAYAPGLQLVKAYPLVPGMYQARVTGQNLTTTLDALKASSKVQFVQPDARITSKLIPNDPRFSELYGLNNTGQGGGAFDADIDAPEAWDSSTGTGQTIVAVIDTGVDYNHPDLKDNIWINPGEIPGNNRDDDGNGYIDDVHGFDFLNYDSDPMDDNSHGTHVAGTIGAVGNNAIGVTGVNWRAKIMALKFLGSDGSGYLSGAIDALNYAVANGAKLSNNSWGGGPFDSTLGRAIANAAARGHIFVAAAGNDSSNNDVTPSYPSGYNYDNIVSVAATDRLDNIAGFSNYGVNTVDIAAPGVSILSTLPNNRYGSYSGTSMATPHVTGALSLYWDANPTANYKDVINALYQSSDLPSTLRNLVGGGGRRLNVAKLMGVSSAPDVTGAKVTASTFTQSSGLAVGATITFSEAIDPTSFTTADITLTGPAGTVAVSSVAAVVGSGNTRFAITFPALSTVGTYTLTVGPRVNDIAGNQMNQNGNSVNGESSDSFTTNWVVNPPPADTTGARVTASTFTLTSGFATSATLTFSEAIDTATFATADVSLTGPAGAVSITSVTLVPGSAEKQFTIAFPALSAAGTYTLKVGPDIRDKSGNLMDQNANAVNGEPSDSFSVNYVVNAPPPADTTGAKITSGLFVQVSGLFTGARVTFSEAVQASSFTTADVAFIGPAGTITISSVTPVAGSGDKQYLISFPALQAFGTYTLRVGPNILDVANNPMDQNGDGQNGQTNDTFSMNLVLQPPADTTGAKIINGFFDLASGVANGATVTFSEAINPASFTPADVVVSGPLGTFIATSVTPVAGSGNTQFKVTFNPLSANGSYSIKIGPNILDLAGNQMDQNGDGAKGQPNDAYTMAWQVGSGQTFTSTRELPIFDMRQTMSTIWVNQDLNIADLNVRLNINHTAVGDLSIVLLSPRFVAYPLFSYRGGLGDNLTNTLFDDQASFAIRNGVAPFSGSFRPEFSLASLNGQNARGGWTLAITDNQWRDIGKLVNWSLEFNTSTQSAGRSTARPAAIGRAPALGISQVAAAPIWKGGALLSIVSALQADNTQSIALAPANPYQPAPTQNSTSGARSTRTALMDNLLWSALARELTPPAKK